MTNDTNRNNSPIQFLGSNTTPEGKIVPEILLVVQRLWTRRSNSSGDIGEITVGAMLEFSYRGQIYLMPPICKWRGCGSWEYCIKEIVLWLEVSGATNIHYHRGIIDYDSYS
jgi:hypothetical protein